MSRKPAQQGDIVSITLDPTAGSEIRGTRPVLILSNAEFNRNGRALAAPITQGGNIERVAGWAVTLMGSGSATQGGGGGEPVPRARPRSAWCAKN